MIATRNRRGELKWQNQNETKIEACRFPALTFRNQVPRQGVLLVRNGGASLKSELHPPK
jgi:hypothetical protein